jgi:hypothetical protein
MLQADVPSDLETGLIKKKQRQQPRHPSIGVGKGMDAEKIEHVCRNEQKWIDFTPFPLFSVSDIFISICLSRCVGLHLPAGRQVILFAGSARLHPFVHFFLAELPEPTDLVTRHMPFADPLVNRIPLDPYIGRYLIHGEPSVIHYFSPPDLDFIDCFTSILFS